MQNTNVCAGFHTVSSDLVFKFKNMYIKEISPLSKPLLKKEKTKV